MPKLNVQQNNQNIIQAFKNALAIGRLKGIIASDGNHNFSTSGSNPNLLDNAYFVGGGSQLGDGIFPINQRGQTSYGGGATTNVDRWWTQHDTATRLTSAGMRITGKWDVDQRLPQVLPSGTYTFSVNVVSLGSTGAVLQFLDENYQQLASAPLNNAGITSFTLTSDRIRGVGVNLAKPDGSGDITFASMKLEKGTVSTLANDAPPNFGEELEKCKRYLQRVRQPQGYTSSVGFGMVGAASNILRTTIPLSSPLRNAASITATATNTGQIFVWGNGSYYSVTGVTGRAVLNGNTIVDITVNGTLENYKTYNLILNNADAYIDLSAEI